MLKYLKGSQLGEQVAFFAQICWISSIIYKFVCTPPAQKSEDGIIFQTFPIIDT